MIKCNTFFNEKKLVPKEKLKFRPSAYAVIINKKKILLLNIRSTGRFSFPGGGVEIGEKIKNALKREIKEEIGAEIKIGEFLQFQESFGYYDPYDEAYQNISFFFLCDLKENKPFKNMIEENEEINPEWVDISSLKIKDFQVYFQKFVQFLKNNF